MKDRFFVYCNESGFDTHETIEGAIEDANDRIPNYLDEGWSEDVTSVCVGKITHGAKMCDQVFPDGEIDEDGIDDAGEYWDSDYECKCNYKMLPVEQNPAPDVSMLVRVLEKCREIINPPEQNCSCHISPPCADCIDYGFEREVADEIDAALEAYRQQGGES